MNAVRGFMPEKKRGGVQVMQVRSGGPWNPTTGLDSLGGQVAGQVAAALRYMTN